MHGPTCIFWANRTPVLASVLSHLVSRIFIDTLPRYIPNQFGVWSVKCLNWSIVTRAHVPRQFVLHIIMESAAGMSGLGRQQMIEEGAPRHRRHRHSDGTQQQSQQDSCANTYGAAAGGSRRQRGMTVPPWPRRAGHHPALVEPRAPVLAGALDRARCPASREEIPASRRCPASRNSCVPQPSSNLPAKVWSAMDSRLEVQAIPVMPTDL